MQPKEPSDISAQLAQIHSQLSHLTSMMAEMQKAQAALNTRYEDAIYNRETGLIIQVDRLQQNAGRASKFIWILVAAVVGLIGTMIFHH